MNETRMRLFASRLLPELAAELSPDAAGSKALALALLAAQAEDDLGARADTLAVSENLTRDIHLLPSFLAWERAHAGSDELVTLVRRFVRGARPQAGPGPPIHDHSVAARRRARLDELRSWGVDLSLIEATLAQTPAERITNMERQLLVVRQLQQAKREQEAGR